MRDRWIVDAYKGRLLVGKRAHKTEDWVNKREVKREKSTVRKEVRVIFTVDERTREREQTVDLLFR